MTEDRRTTFPMMATTHWWSLRRKFRSAIPREVTANYLAAVLGMNENSARTNIMPSLRQTGIVDKDNKPTDVAVRWRDDGKYPEVCAAILRAVYPQELIDLAPDTSASRDSVRSWFANHTGTGESGVLKMVAFYWMLLEADPSKQTEVPAREPTPRGVPKVTAKPAKATPAKGTLATTSSAGHTVNGTDTLQTKRRHPDLHINVQIHISPDSTAEQIEQIFASMAKNLREFF